jgi:serine phosphatase RsbU (regulator of sigma subunit)
MGSTSADRAVALMGKLDVRAAAFLHHANAPHGLLQRAGGSDGAPQLGGKTVLYMLDGLYTAENNEGNVFRFASFGMLGLPVC